MFLRNLLVLKTIDHLLSKVFAKKQAAKVFSINDTIIYRFINKKLEPAKKIEKGQYLGKYLYARSIEYNGKKIKFIRFFSPAQKQEFWVIENDINIK